MINDNTKYIGSAIVSMIDSYDEDGIFIRRIVDDKSGFYLINDKLPILCKYSTKRTNPWSFTLTKEITDRYISLVKQYNECLLVLICGTDGIVSLDYLDVCQVINFDLEEEQKRISASRKHKEMYAVSGSDGSMKHKISQKSIGEKLNKILQGA